MELGQIVDYVEEWNEVHKAELSSSGGETGKEERRWATQADWDALMG